MDQVVRDGRFSLTCLFGEKSRNFDIFWTYRPRNVLESFPDLAGAFPGSFLMYHITGSPIESVWAPKTIDFSDFPLQIPSDSYSKLHRELAWFWGTPKMSDSENIDHDISLLKPLIKNPLHHFWVVYPHLITCEYELPTPLGGRDYRLLNFRDGNFSKVVNLNENP